MTLPMWCGPMHSWRLVRFIPEGEHSSVSKSVDLAKRERIVNDSFGIRSWQSISCQRPMLLLPSLAHGQLGFGRIIHVLDKAWNESGIWKFYSSMLQKTSKVTITERLLKVLNLKDVQAELAIICLEHASAVFSQDFKVHQRPVGF